MDISEPIQQELVRRACEVRQHAYAKYSQFYVGASVLTADGTYFDGANVENASFGLTTCAERSAIFAAISHGHRELIAIAIASPGQHYPCGACRQVMTEFAPELQVLLVAPDYPDKIQQANLSDLLPGRFEFPT